MFAARTILATFAAAHSLSCTPKLQKSQAKDFGAPAHSTLPLLTPATATTNKELAALFGIKAPAIPAPKATRTTSSGDPKAKSIALSYENIDGSALIKREAVQDPKGQLRTDDMIIIRDPEDDLSIYGSIRYITKVWPLGLIPYQFDTGMPTATRALIQSAMNQWMLYTDLAFIPATKEARILLISTTSSTNANTCVLGSTHASRLSLAGVSPLGSILHALGHCLGLSHEHQRIDRDKFLEVFPTNILEGTTDAFEKFGTPGLSLGPYDLSSIMNACPTELAKSNTYTILLKGDDAQRFIYDCPKDAPDAHISAGDLAAISTLYAEEFAHAKAAAPAAATTNAAAGTTTPSLQPLTPKLSRGTYTSSSTPNTSATITLIHALTPTDIDAEFLVELRLTTPQPVSVSKLVKCRDKVCSLGAEKDVFTIVDDNRFELKVPGLIQPMTFTRHSISKSNP